MSRRMHLGCLNRNNSSGSSEFIHHPDIAGCRQGWIPLEQNPWTFVDTYRIGIFAIVLLQYQYLDISSIYIIRCTQSTFQHSWLEHLLLLKMHVHCVSCLPWYLGICVRWMIHDWNWSKGYPRSCALKTRRILPSQCCQILGDYQACMSVRKWESEERAKELLVVWSKMFYQ